MANEDKSIVLPRLRFPEFMDIGGWSATALHELATFVTEKVGATDCTPYTVTSGVGLVSQMDKLGRTIAGDSLKNYVVLQRNDFAYNKSATKAFPEGYIARYVGEERAAVPNSVFTCFRVDDQRIAPEYLDYLFASNLHGKWLRKYIAVGARAHGSLNVSDADLMALPVPMPAGPNSLKEQRKIAGCLTSLDGVIAAQGRNVEAVKTYKRGLMQQLFPSRGETVPCLRFKQCRNEPHWSVQPLGALTRLQSGFAFSSDFFSSKGQKLVTPKNFTKTGFGIFDDSVSKYTTEEVSSKYLCRPGDLLVLLTDLTPTCELLGQPLEVTKADGDLLLNQRIVRIEPTSNVIAKGFLKQFLQSEAYREVIVGTATGTTVRHSSNKVLEAIEVAFPGPDEQQCIAACLSSLDAKIVGESRKLNALKAHKTGLMQQIYPSQGVS